MQAGSQGDCLKLCLQPFPSKLMHQLVPSVLCTSLSSPKLFYIFFVSDTVPRSPVNKLFSIDQIPATFSTTDDTYPLAPFVFAHVPSVLFSQNRFTFSSTSLSYSPAVPSFQAILQHIFILLDVICYYIFFFF